MFAHLIGVDGIDDESRQPAEREKNPAIGLYRQFRLLSEPGTSITAE